MPTTPGAELLALVTRLADRLRGLPTARLGALDAPASPAGRAHQLAQRLADAEQGAVDRAADRAPAWRILPALGAGVVADQVAVTGYDAAAALGGLDPAEPVWTREGRRPAGEVLAELVTEARQVTRALR